MKTNKLWSILMMLCVVLCGTIAFSSCKKEEVKEESSNNGNNSILGTWRAIGGYSGNNYEDLSGDDYIISLSFKSNGTGVFQEIEDGDIDKESFKYEYDSTLGTIHLFFDDFEDYLTISMTKNQFRVLHDFNDNFFEGLIFVKQ